MAEAGFVESGAEMEEMLRREAWGCLGLCTPEGAPYVVPVNYAYVEGKILFHCALEGQKLDCIRANPNVCFTVARQPGTVREHPGGDPATWTARASSATARPASSRTSRSGPTC